MGIGVGRESDELELGGDLLALIGLDDAVVYWIELAGDLTRIGYVAGDTAMTAHLVTVAERPRVLGFDVGWPVFAPFQELTHIA